MKNVLRKRPHRLGLVGLCLIAISLTALIPVAVAVAQAVSFSPATDFAVGTAPISVAIGDLNGDGNPDLAVANHLSNNVSILLGTGTGAFESATNFAAGANPGSVAIGDLNDDGKPDLAVANVISGNVSILLGDGTGAFGSATNFAAAPRPRSVAIGDLNGDGKPDLAVVNDASDNVSILLGTGTGAFGSATNFAVGDNPPSGAIGDLNGDGKPDLAVANNFSNNVSILLGDGTGAFGSATNFAAGTGPQSVAIGDLNGDGNPDLAMANHTGGDVSILLGTGTGTFGPATNFAVGAGPGPYTYSVAIGDLNGDGKPDLAVANSNSSNVSILLGTGTGTFGSATVLAVGAGQGSVAIGDLNGDGKPDLATANMNSTTVSILINTYDTTPPTVEAGSPYTVNEGSSVMLTANGTDPKGQPLIYAWDLDNNGIFETPGQSVSFTGVDGPATLTEQVQVTDSGGQTAVDSATVTVNNIAPVLGTITAPTSPVKVSTLVNASADFTDKGVVDTHTAAWNWGDGTTSNGIVTESNGSGSVTGSHSYTAAGLYTVKLIVTDKDGASGQPTFLTLVVYNPQGGFVTGGGWFNSPVGAYHDKPTKKGQAVTAFVVKYLKNASVPSGSLDFVFLAGNLQFKAITFDWLIVDQTNKIAQFQGSGRINGSGNYKFMIWTSDKNPDTFRIKIWKLDGTVVYDNGSNLPLYGGVVVINK